MAETATAETETATTLEDVFALAQRFSPVDQARLIERLTSGIITVLGAEKKTPRPSLYGILAHLGPAPSAEDIDEMRREAFANFPREIYEYSVNNVSLYSTASNTMHSLSW